MTRSRCIGHWILVLLLLLAVAVSLEAAQPSTAHKTRAKAKIDSAVVKVMEMAATQRAASAQSARAMGVPFDGNSVTLTLVLDPRQINASSQGAVRVAVNQTFGNSSVVRAQSKTFFRLKVPVTSLPLIELLTLLMPNIAYIRAPLVPQTLAISEGVGLIGANQLHDNGSLGQGTKIAIIDLGFAGMSRARSLGELPANVVVRDFTGSGLEFGTSHGTSVAEIVHDVAPNAQLYLMKIGDEIDLENAVNEAIAQGVDIINHSVGWFNTSYYDGTGSIASIVQQALSAGILWVNSAGNYAQRHFKGLFRDNNNNGWAEFSGNDETIDIVARTGETIQLFLTWRDWPLTAQDYDLALFNPQGAQVAVSDKTQGGSQEPTESLLYFVPSSGTYQVRVQAFSAASPKELTLFSLFHNIEHAVAQSSIVTPADMNGVLSVAAVRQENWSTGPQAPYSSQGPTNDGRPKPDIAAPDNVRTSTQGAFEGTSAAAPHVAGAAALLLSQNPNQSGAQLGAQLKATASPLGSTLATGSGRVTLVAPPSQRPDLTIFNTDFAPRSPTVGDTLQHTISVRNQGQAAAGTFLVRLQDSNGADQRTVPNLAAGATANVTFSRPLNVTNDTINVTVDATNQVTESNENNNSAQYQVSAQAPPPPPPSGRPDLIVESLEVSPSNPNVGGALQLTLRVRNQGDAAAGPFSVALQGAASNLSQSLGGLNVGASARLVMSTSLTSSGQTFTAVADAQNQVAESNENNNTRSVTVQGNTPPPPPPPPTSGGPQGSIRTDRRVYQLGDAIRIDFTTDQRAYAYIYNVDATGRVGQVFPNRLSRNNLITPPSYSLPDGPYRFRVTGPEGTESVHLLLSLRPINPGVSGLRNSRLTDLATFRAELESRVSRQLGRDQWSIASAAFQVGNGTPPPPPPQPSPTPPPANQPPRAAFSVTPSAPLVGEQVTYDASASNDSDGRITQFRWDLNGDGSPDVSGQRVTTSYRTAGVFSVRLTVVDDRGASASTTQNVQVTAPAVNRPPVPEFSVSPSAPLVGERVTFDASASTDSDGRITQFQWDLNGDGATDASGQRVTGSFPAAGIIHVRLTVVDNEGASASNTVAVQVTAPTVNRPPVPDFTFDPAQPRVGELVVFDASLSSDPDGRIVDYRWDLNSDGRIDVVGVRVSARFNAARAYQATLTVTDDKGMTTSVAQTVQVGRAAPPPNQPPTARFTFAPGTPLVGQAITLDASTSFDGDGSIVDYRWDFDSDGLVDSIGVSVTTQFNAAGTYRVTLTVLDDGGLNHVAVQNVNVSTPAPPPTPDPAPGSSAAPVPSSSPGVYFLSTKANELRVVVQGSPSWTSRHKFFIQISLLNGSNMRHKSINKSGEASGSPNNQRSNFIRYSGSVGNGWIEFVLSARMAGGRAVMTAELDLDGDGTRDRTSKVTKLVANNKVYASKTNGFVLKKSSGSMTPFRSGMLFCPNNATSDRQCTTIR